MRQLIPFILEQEYECICQEVKGKDVAIIFDGTTRDGEALVVLVRFVESWTIKQRLVRLRLLKSSVNGDELARIIIERHSRNTRYSSINAVCPKYRRESEGGRSFAVSATRLWNSIPIEIRKLESVACFKKTMFAKIFKEQQCLHHFII